MCTSSCLCAPEYGVRAHPRSRVFSELANFCMLLETLDEIQHRLPPPMRHEPRLKRFYGEPVRSSCSNGEREARTGRTARPIGDHCMISFFISLFHGLFRWCHKTVENENVHWCFETVFKTFGIPKYWSLSRHAISSTQENLREFDRGYQNLSWMLSIGSRRSPFHKWLVDVFMSVLASKSVSKCLDNWN